jgi:hypothetical protein
MQLVAEGFNELLAYFGPAAAIPDPYERVFAFGRGYVRFAEERPETYRLIFMEEDELTQHVLGDLDDENMPGNSAFEAISSTVAELVASGVFKPIDPDDGARILWAGLHGLISLKVSCPDSPFGDVDFRHLTDVMLDALAHGLCRTPAPV